LAKVWSNTIEFRSGPTQSNFGRPTRSNFDRTKLVEFKWANSTKFMLGSTRQISIRVDAVEFG